MLDRKKLMDLPQLMLDESILAMDNDQFFKYTQLLVMFIDAVPAQEESLKAALDSQNYVSYIESLAAVWDTLVKIQAHDLARQSLEQIEGLKKLTHDKNLAHEKIVGDMNRFTAALSTLSIDIQMVLYREEADRLEGENKRSNEKVILAVDDASFFLTMLSNCLKQLPFTTVCVNSGAAALRFLETHTPALFILDIEMPGMSGFELAHLIRKGGQQAPIIFLTANATKDNVQKAFASGGSDFIVKPINTGLVLSKVRQYLGLPPQ
ncbi:MAG: response regulator [Oscillospiraceae bacterium]|nr:response regulator [Oscillospiraceae bacterium]